MQKCGASKCWQPCYCNGLFQRKHRFGCWHPYETVTSPSSSLTLSSGLRKEVAKLAGWKWWRGWRCSGERGGRWREWRLLEDSSLSTLGIFRWAAAAAVDGDVIAAAADDAVTQLLTKLGDNGGLILLLVEITSRSIKWQHKKYKQTAAILK